MLSNSKINSSIESGLSFVEIEIVWPKVVLQLILAEKKFFRHFDCVIMTSFQNVEFIFTRSERSFHISYSPLTAESAVFTNIQSSGKVPFLQSEIRANQPFKKTVEC